MIEYVMAVLSYAVPFLFVFTMVVFFHELGHFLVARWNGVFVETFSIGMGKELVSRTDRYGTKWRLALFPLGGYCKMRGEEDGLTEQPDNTGMDTSSPVYKNSCYDNKNPYQRIAIASAGPIANFILAIVILWGVFFIFGARQAQPEIVSVQPNSPALAAGLRAGDVVLSINDKMVYGVGDITRLVGFSVGEEVRVKVVRAGAELVLLATPKLGEISDSLGGKQITGTLGIVVSEKEITRKNLGLFSALGASVLQVGQVFNLTFTYLGQLVVGKQDSSQLSGPIRIVKLTGDFNAQKGFTALLVLAAMLSISLGIVNLLPVPMLDGGHIVFYIIEAVKGSPLSEAVQGHAMRVGMFLILCLMVFVTLNDIVHLGWLGAG